MSTAMAHMGKQRFNFLEHKRNFHFESQYIFPVVFYLFFFPGFIYYYNHKIDQKLLKLLVPIESISMERTASTSLVTVYLFWNVQRNVPDIWLNNNTPSPSCTHRQKVIDQELKKWGKEYLSGCDKKADNSTAVEYRGLS